MNNAKDRVQQLNLLRDAKDNYVDITSIPLELRERGIRECFEKGLRMDTKDGLGFSIFMHAIQGGRSEILPVLFELGADPNERFRKSSALGGKDLEVPALHYAADQPAALDLLIAKGVDINATDDQGRTALHVACSFKSADSVLKLLQSGIRLDVRDEEGRTAMDEAEMKQDEQVLAILRSYQAAGVIHEAQAPGTLSSVRPL